MLLLKMSITTALYVFIIFLYYGTEFAIRNAISGLSLFERVTELTPLSRIILASGELFYIGLWWLLLQLVHFAFYLFKK